MIYAKLYNLMSININNWNQTPDVLYKLKENHKNISKQNTPVQIIKILRDFYVIKEVEFIEFLDTVYNKIFSSPFCISFSFSFSCLNHTNISGGVA